MQFPNSDVVRLSVLWQTKQNIFSTENTSLLRQERYANLGMFRLIRADRRGRSLSGSGVGEGAQGIG